MKKLLLFILALILIASCQKDNNSENNVNISSIKGYVQKGPYINGTSITLYKLNNNLEQLGTSYSANILDNKGRFELANLSFPSKYVLFYANGFYYNEVSGVVSTAPLQLYSLANITNAPSVNVNVMTHLERRRVEYLVKQGKTFSEAKKTAQQDILNIFTFQLPSISQSEKLDINVDGDENAILLAISLILQGNLSVGDFSELLSTISADLEQDGKLYNATALDKLKSNVFNLNLPNIRKNLESRYQSLGLTATIPNFEKYIQQYLSTFPIDITTGLVAYYPFNGNANDESGNGNNGIVNGATLTADRFGTDNKAYSFNGVDNVINIPSSQSLAIPNFISIAAWIYKDNGNNDLPEGIVGPATYLPQNPGYFLRINYKKLELGISYPYVQGNTVANLTGSKWYFVVATYDNNSIRTYVDGILDNHIQIGSGYLDAWTSQNPITIGQEIDYASPSYLHPWNGKLDDIRIYNRTLTQEQITYLATH